MTARSWNSSTAKASRPWRAVSCPRSDDKQQQHHAQFGELQGLAHFAAGLDGPAQAPGPDEHACRQIAQHRTQLQALEQSHEYHGGQQEHRGNGEEVHVVIALR